MKKNFIQWNNEKIKTDNSDSRVFFHEREIWWCKIGINIGFEQDGKGDTFARPVIIFKKFNKEVFWAIPLTTRIKVGKFYVQINLEDKKERVAIISQLRLIDAKRLYQKIGVINEIDYNNVKSAIIKLCQ